MNGPRREPHRTRGAERGQTTIDFAIGVGLFLLVVAFVVGFVPTIFAPFASADGPGAADRLATSLSTDRLGDPSEPYVLNETCTDAFFAQLNENSSDTPTSCAFDTTADTTAELFSPGPTTDVNVSIRTLDGTVIDDGDYAAGPPVSETTSVTAATRVVYLRGEPHRLLVRTW